MSKPTPQQELRKALEGEIGPGQWFIGMWAEYQGRVAVTIDYILGLASGGNPWHVWSSNRRSDTWHASAVAAKQEADRRIAG